VLALLVDDIASKPKVDQEDDFIMRWQSDHKIFRLDVPVDQLKKTIIIDVQYGFTLLECRNSSLVIA
jgi:hypothetical protein